MSKLSPDDRKILEQFVKLVSREQREELKKALARLEERYAA